MSELRDLVLDHAWAKATDSTYKSGVKSLTRYLAIRNRNMRSLTEVDLAMWCQYEGQFITVKAIKSYLYGVRRHVILQGERPSNEHTHLGDDAQRAEEALPTPTQD